MEEIIFLTPPVLPPVVGSSFSTSTKPSISSTPEELALELTAELPLEFPISTIKKSAGEDRVAEDVEASLDEQGISSTPPGAEATMKQSIGRLPSTSPATAVEGDTPSSAPTGDAE